MQHQDTIPLVQTTRGALVETVHRGAVAVVNTTGQILYAAGNPELKTAQPPSRFNFSQR